MADNIHPVVELLAARMESHPEEFEPNGGGRWAEWLDRLIPFVTEEERVMLRGPMMQGIHEEVLDELLNGEERRAQSKRERDLEMQRIMAQAQQQAALQPGQYMQAQSLGALQTMGIGIATPSQPLTLQSSGKEALRIGSGGELQIGTETLDESLISNIRKKLGL